MDRRSVKRLILCAGLMALAAPLRAGEATWASSPDHKHIIQVAAGWTSAAAVPGLGPKGITHAFTLAPASRAFVLDIAAEYTLSPNYVSTEEYFAKARARAGYPTALRTQLKDYSLFEYFTSSAAVKGRAGWRAQGVLHKYVQRYYLTFSSTRGYPGDKEWQDALRLLASLDNDEPETNGWEKDFLKKVSDIAGPGGPEAAGKSLRFTSAARADGTRVMFEDIALFGCKNFAGNQYLFNEDRTAHCWIATMEDYKAILPRLERRFWRDSPPDFEDCPASMRLERACDPEKMRYFQAGPPAGAR